MRTISGMATQVKAKTEPGIFHRSVGRITGKHNWIERASDFVSNTRTMLIFKCR